MVKKRDATTKRQKRTRGGIAAAAAAAATTTTSTTVDDSCDTDDHKDNSTAIRDRNTDSSSINNKRSKKTNASTSTSNANSSNASNKPMTTTTTTGKVAGAIGQKEEEVLLLHLQLDLTSCTTKDEIQSTIDEWLESHKKNMVKKDENQHHLQLHVTCSYFPRGSMEILLDKTVNSIPNLQLTRFVAYCGNTMTHNVTNPDLKFLFKTCGTQLQELRILPKDEMQEGDDEKKKKKKHPLFVHKMEGCGYRWLAKHVTNLSTLELSLFHDQQKKQLLPSLQTTNLQSLTLRDMDADTDMLLYKDQIIDVIKRSPKLSKVRIITHNGNSSSSTEPKNPSTKLIKNNELLAVVEEINNSRSNDNLLTLVIF